LQQVSDQIDERIRYVCSLECTEDTVGIVKTERAQLNKDFNDLEYRRKSVKSMIMKPYEEFETIYKQYISNKYKDTDLLLKERIDLIEGTIKGRKRAELESYFHEYWLSKNIEFYINLSDANIPIRLSDSMKSLMSQARSFIDKVAEDVDLINQQKYSEEILREYIQSFNCSKAITTVNNWHNEIEKATQRKQETIDSPVREPVAEPVEPAPEEERTLTFTVTATISKLKELKKFLVEGRYSFK